MLLSYVDMPLMSGPDLGETLKKTRGMTKQNTIRA